MNYYTATCFKNVCRQIGGIKGKEIEILFDELKVRNPEGMINHEATHFYPEIMYEVFISNEKCRKRCEEKNYKYWEQMAERCEDIMNYDENKLNDIISRENEKINCDLSE